jgi:hypothetical protein
MREALGLSYVGNIPGGHQGINSDSVEKLGSFHQTDVEAEKIKGKD